MTETEQLADVIALSIHAATEPLRQKVAALERDLAALRLKEGPVGPAGEKGDQGDQGDSGQPGAPGRDGKDADAPDLDVIAQKAAALVPLPKNGVDGKDALPPDLDLLAQKAAALVPKPTDGKDGQNGKDAVLPDLDVIAMKAAALVPRPTDGKDGFSVTADDVAPLIVREVKTAVDGLRQPKDGIGIAESLIDRGGSLVLTFTDGTVKNIGQVVGRDGLNADPVMVKALILDEVAKIPKPDNGIDGKNGLDGLGFDDLDVAFDQTKGWLLRWTKGDQVRERAIPIPFDAGIWEAGRTYPKGAGVTVRGAWWIAQHDTKERPEDGSGSKAWRLAVKGGRDGKPGRDGKDGGE